MSIYVKSDDAWKVWANLRYLGREDSPLYYRIITGIWAITASPKVTQKILSKDFKRRLKSRCIPSLLFASFFFLFKCECFRKVIQFCINQAVCFSKSCRICTKSEVTEVIGISYTWSAKQVLIVGKHSLKSATVDFGGNCSAPCFSISMGDSMG